MKLRIFFAWYDLWVGMFIDPHRYTVYVCLLPCVVISFQWKVGRKWKRFHNDWGKTWSPQVWTPRTPTAEEVQYYADKAEREREAAYLDNTGEPFGKDDRDPHIV